jgi:hypothetical protein
MGHTSFGQKKPISRRSCHKAMPPRLKTPNGRIGKGGDFATKSPANSGHSNFPGVYIANRISVVKIAFVKAANIYILG